MQHAPLDAARALLNARPEGAARPWRERKKTDDNLSCYSEHLSVNKELSTLPRLCENQHTVHSTPNILVHLTERHRRGGQEVSYSERAKRRGGSLARCNASVDSRRPLQVSPSIHIP